MIHCDKQEYQKKSKDDVIDELFDLYEENERLKKDWIPLILLMNYQSYLIDLKLEFLRFWCI